MQAQIIVRLGRYRILHQLVAVLHIYPIAGAFLRRFPLVRRRHGAGIVYRITSLDQLSIEIEIFGLESYASALSDQPVNTLIDLGCNAGWFPVWLSSKFGSQIRGLLVDAHPRMVTEAAWHLKQNGLENLSVVHAAVGLPPGQSRTEFHLHPSASASTVLPLDSRKQIPIKGKITNVDVPAITIADEWRTEFGDTDVDLMKIDIEGKELDLLVYESAFVRNYVRKVVVEWHKWGVSFAQLDAQLQAMGFTPQGVHHEGPLTGIAVYDNTGKTRHED